MLGLRSGQGQGQPTPNSTPSSSVSPPRTRQSRSHTYSQQLPSPPQQSPPRRSSSKRSTPQPVPLSPTLSSLSSLSSSSELGLLQHVYSPTPLRTSNRNKYHNQAPPSPVSVNRIPAEIPFSVDGELSPTLNATLKGKGRAGRSTPTLLAPPKKERQTRLQEHLKSSKASISYAKQSGKKTKKQMVQAIVEMEVNGAASETSSSAEDLVKVVRMSEGEVQARLEVQKEGLRQRLGSLGLTPSTEELDQALSAMDPESSLDDDKVASFFRALAPISSSLVDSLSNDNPSLLSFRKAVAFESTAEDPHLLVHNHPELTPIPLLRRAQTSPNPPTAYFHEPRTPTSTSASLAPSPEILLATPAARRNGRVNAFGLRRSNSTMVAAELQGMGRVAMAKELLFERLGPATAEQAISAAAESSVLPLHFGQAPPPIGSPIIDTFSLARSSSDIASSSRLTQEQDFNSRLDGNKLGLVRAWLDSPEMTDEESRESWSTIPREWDEDLDAYHKIHQMEQNSSPFAVASEEEEVEVEEVRVGGKNVRVLLRTKRRRDLEVVRQPSVEEMEIEDDDVSVLLNDDEDVDRASVMSGRISTIRKGKGRASASPSREVCYCQAEEDDEEDELAMVECDACQVWYHLECLNITSARHLGKEWFCFRCSDQPQPQRQGPSPSKRSRIFPSTPVINREPILVPSAFSPRAKGNFYKSDANDMVLAPSPQPSPSRRPTPMLAPPVTPQAGQARADYSPRSPLFHRTSRSRMISGQFEDLPQAGWVGTWDKNGFTSGSVFGDSSTLLIDEDELPPRSWHDLTMTPSRQLSSSTSSWGESLLQTPLSVLRRGVGSTPVGTSASQDFLSGLHQGLPTPESLHPDNQTITIAQRLFAGSHHVVPSSSPHGPSNYSLSSSPLAPKHRGGHARMPSIPSFLNQSARSLALLTSSSSSSTSSEPADENDITTDIKLENTLGRLSPSPDISDIIPVVAPSGRSERRGRSAGMQKSGSGLGIGFTGGLDGLA